MDESVRSELARNAEARCTGCGIDEVAAALRQCGFDEAAYLRACPDLVGAAVDPRGALLHFLAHGYRERRPLFLDHGLEDLTRIAALPLDAEYRNGLCYALWRFHTLSERLDGGGWNGLVDGRVQLSRATQGLPFLIIGDSHSNLYVRGAADRVDWLAPLHLLCTGGSAMGLANSAARSGYGPRLLSWAHANRNMRQGVPIFLKFGQVDAEFVSVFRRIRDGQSSLASFDFEAFASESVAKYMTFLLELRARLVGAELKVCSIFPPVLSDESWAEGYVNAHIGFLEGDRGADELATAIRNLELPDLHARTEQHVLYNALLERACAGHGFAFVDDCTALLDPAGVVRDEYRSACAGTDHHIPHSALETDIGRVIRVQSSRVHESAGHTIGPATIGDLPLETMTQACVVGMHRSGTSVLTSALSRLGFDLGDPARLMPPKPDNPDGFFEHLDFVKLNTDLLQALGGDWDLPPPAVAWEERPEVNNLRARGAELLDSAFGGAANRLWKDPRTSLTLGYWLGRCPDLKIVVCLRGPLATARSLHDRGGQSLRFGLQLWEDYYRAILSVLPRRQAIVTHYDVLRAFPEEELARIGDFLRIAPAPHVLRDAASIVRTTKPEQLPVEVDQLKELSSHSAAVAYDALRSMAGPNYLRLPEAKQHPPREHAEVAAVEALRVRDGQALLIEVERGKAASARAAELERWLSAQIEAKLALLVKEQWPAGGLVLDFAAGGNAWLHTLHGWATPEPAGCWTDGHGAAIALPPLPAETADVVVRMTASPHLDGRGGQRVRVVVGELVVHETILSVPTQIAFRVGAASFASGALPVLGFQLPDAFEPARAGTGPDRRRLGMLVTKCSVVLHRGDQQAEVR